MSKEQFIKFGPIFNLDGFNKPNKLFHCVSGDTGECLLVSEASTVFSVTSTVTIITLSSRDTSVDAHHVPGV